MVRLINTLKNLNLSEKALLATMVPFIVNVAWLVGMWSNVLRFEHLADLEHEQSNLVEDVNLLLQANYEAQSAFPTAFYTGTKLRYEIYVQALDKLHQLAHPLMNNPHLLDTQKVALRELEKFSDFQRQFLIDNQTSEGAEGTEDRWRQFATRRKLFLGIFKKRFEDQRDFKDFTSHQRQELDRLREIEKTQVRVFLIILIAGVSSNLVIAFFVHYLFSRHVTQQIDNLVLNAKALSKKRPMLEPLQGKNDFAVIDATLHQSQKELAEAVAYRQTLMQMITHDLKSPLAASQVSLAIILDREAETLNARGIKILNGVISNNKRLLALIGDLLTIDAFESGHLDLAMKKASISDCISEAIDTLNSLAALKSITIIKNIDATDAYFDYQKILQVVVNLLSNAIKFSKKNSQIAIQCENISSRKLKIKIVDQGSGIPEADKPMIFKKYFQTEDGKRAAGTGLGLAICKFIIEAHGEEIGFESAETGCTFWFSVSKSSARQ